MHGQPGKLIRMNTISGSRQCLGSDYGDDMPPIVRKTPQRTVAIDDELWKAAQRIAAKRREKVSDVLRAALRDYVDQYRVLDTVSNGAGDASR